LSGVADVEVDSKDRAEAGGWTPRRTQSATVLKTTRGG